MSITDELRRVAAKTECANGRCEKLYRGDLDQIADRIVGVSPQTIRHAYSGAWVLPYAYVEPTAWVPPRTPAERAAALAVDALSDESRERLKAMLERAMPSHYPRTRGDA